MASRRRSTAFGIDPERMALCRDAWPWIFVPSVDTLPHCPPSLCCQTHPLHHHVLQRLKRPLAEIAAGATVWTVLAHKSPEGEGAFASQGDLPARHYPHAVGREQQADHPGWIGGRGAPGFGLIRGIEAAALPLGHGIKEAADPVALGQRGRRALCLLPRALRLPGTRRFPPAFTHHRAPNIWVIEVSYAEKSLIV